MPLTVNEIFGPTVQGEGPSAGRRAVFLRLANCNLFCSWCDTCYSWDWTGRNGTQYDRTKERRYMEFGDVRRALRAVGLSDNAMLVVTGGEPMLQQEQLSHLFDTTRGVSRIEVETNGTKAPENAMPENVHYVVSPKLENSGISEHLRLVWPSLGILALWERSIFKFVVEAQGDLLEVLDIQERLALESDRIWIMPQAQTRGELEGYDGRLAEWAVGYGFNYTSRLQVLAWNGKRGR